jgi:PAS domain-containing protein
LEQAYKLAFDASPIAGILTDASGKILSANNKSAKLLKCLRDNLIGRQIWEIIPEVPGIVGDDCHECQVICTDGTEFPAEIKSTLFEIGGNTVIFRTITDITETRKLIADLKERVKEQQTVLRVTETLFKAEKPETMFEQSLDFIREGWQYPEHTLVRIKLDNGTEFATAGFVETRWRLAAEIQLDEKPYGSIEVFYDFEVPSHGGSVFLDEEKNLIDTLAKLFSIFLHQWYTVKKLQESQAMINKVTALTPVNTYQFELLAQGKVKILFASRGMSFKNLRFTAEEIIDDSEKLLGHLHPEDRPRFDEAVKKSYATLEDINLQYRLVIENKETWRWLRATAEKLDNGKVIWYGSTQDITQIIEYIDVLEQILFDISHVMRKPVSTMLGLTDYLIKQDDMSENTLKDFAGHIKTVALEMDDYIKKLNDAYHQKRLSITASNGESFSQLIEMSKKMK